jgi:hypothetical protein
MKDPAQPDLEAPAANFPVLWRLQILIHTRAHRLRPVHRLAERGTTVDRRTAV